MTYSCAIFEDLDGDFKNGTEDRGSWSGGEGLERIGSKRTNTSIPSMLPPLSPDSLHQAQLRKLHHIITKADIRPGNRVLEVGSGWGSLAIEAVRLTGCTVDTITLSVHQQVLAQQRIREAGFEDRITVHLMDYRNMPPEWAGAFDRFISIEMIEAVGREFLEKYWSVVDWALKGKGGVGVVQVITIPEPRKSVWPVHININITERMQGLIAIYERSILSANGYVQPLVFRKEFNVNSAVRVRFLSVRQRLPTLTSIFQFSLAGSFQR